MSVSAQISNNRCQSLELRASRETSSPNTMPALPVPTSPTSLWNPARSAPEAPDCPRSESMTTTRSVGQPNATARSRNAYCRIVLSVFSNTWRTVD